MPPGAVTSIAASIATTAPLHSTAASTGAPAAARTASASAAPDPSVAAMTNSSAPNRRATDSLAGFTSTATSHAARWSRAVCRAFTPIPPIPNTTTTSPGRTPATLRTTPNPVDAAQPTSAAAVGGSAGAGTSCETRTVMSPANDDTFAYDRTGSPRQRKGVAPRPNASAQSPNR